MFARTGVASMRRVLAAKPAFTSWRSLFIQTLETPNENALKFLPSTKILGDGQTKEFLSGREAACLPLAVKLFTVDGVRLVMYGPDFITVEKKLGDWNILKPEIFAILTEYLNNGTPIISEDVDLHELEINDDDDDVVAMIKELIFTRIRPAIQDDGGDIEFVEFKEDTGTVYLRLKGACRSCDSLSVTLKNGIELMLKHYIEEVELVEPIEEEVEEEEPEPQFEAAQLNPVARGPPAL